MKQVLGTEMYDKGIESAIADFLELCEHPPRNLLISPSDANVLVSARTNPDFRKIVDDFFWNLPDGMPSVWMLKLKGAKKVNRISGFDFFEKAIKGTKDLPINHFFCGGQESVAEELIEVCSNWGNHNICGSYSPPFKELSEDEIKAIATKVNETKANVLWVSLGAPKQLYFSHSISKYTNCHFIAPIGAAFDFHVGAVKKAPSWISKSGMEWFYRLAKEPRRLFSRYFYVVPRFIYYNLIDR
jgi:N-acetylglucosaminyldiphosphoundecaprenol N-acetyl-beta-D-mannosaminyltransferase